MYPVAADMFVNLLNYERNALLNINEMPIIFTISINLKLKVLYMMYFNYAKV